MVRIHQGASVTERLLSHPRPPLGGFFRDGAYLVKTRLRDVELTSEVHEWRKVTARAIDRARKTGTDECEFWAPLGESSF